MMGRQKAPEKLFYQFRLEDHVPTDHPLRQLDAVLNFDQTRTVLAGHYSPIGRPSIDPELMLRMLLVGYAYGIRSERQLCNEVHLNLELNTPCAFSLNTFKSNRVWAPYLPFVLPLRTGITYGTSSEAIYPYSFWSIWPGYVRSLSTKAIGQDSIRTMSFIRCMLRCPDARSWAASLRIY